MAEVRKKLNKVYNPSIKSISFNEALNTIKTEREKILDYMNSLEKILKSKQMHKGYVK